VERDALARREQGAQLPGRCPPAGTRDGRGRGARRRRRVVHEQPHQRGHGPAVEQDVLGRQRQREVPAVGGVPDQPQPPRRQLEAERPVDAERQQIRELLVGGQHVGRRVERSPA
jgi:hypothetical protein